MATSSTANKLFKIILITGDPGVGKSTLIRRIYEKLVANNYKNVKGFLTQEIRNEKHLRIGFDAINLKDENLRAPLARSNDQEELTHLRNAPRVGKYLVDVKSFESIALPILNPIESNFIYVIDEIGKMEMFSTIFEHQILQMMNKINNEKFLIVATVPTKSLSLSDKLKSHSSSKLFTLTFQNRNSLVDVVYQQIVDSYESFFIKK